MTEVTAAPATGYDPDQTDVALSTVPAEGAGGFREGVTQAGEKISEFAGDAAGKAGDYASQAAKATGEYAQQAAKATGEYAHQAAKATGEFAQQTAKRIRNNAEIQADRGVTSIANEVVEKIAGYAAREIEGVYDLGGDVARMFASIKERIHLGDRDEDTDRGVTVRLEGKTAAITVVIVIEYGYVVYTVTEAVRAKVVSQVESLLNLDVVSVDISVDDVHIDESKLSTTAKPLEPSAA